MSDFLQVDSAASPRSVEANKSPAPTASDTEPITHICCLFGIYSAPCALAPLLYALAEHVIGPAIWTEACGRDVRHFEKVGMLTVILTPTGVQVQSAAVTRLGSRVNDDLALTRGMIPEVSLGDAPRTTHPIYFADEEVSRA